MKKLRSLLVIPLLLAACTSAPLPATPTPTLEPTQTPTSTFTPAPTPTVIPKPTKTPAPTRTPTLTPTIVLAKEVYFAKGGFAFSPLPDYFVHYDDNTVMISDLLNTEFIQLSVEKLPRKGIGEKELLAGFVGGMDGKWQSITPGEPYSLTVGQKPGLAVDIEGLTGHDPVKGTAALAMLDEERFLFASGIVYLEDKPAASQKQAGERFQTILDTLRFPDPSEFAQTCPVSTDKTYGYTPENPIKIGAGSGDIFDAALIGPSRENAYFENLTGPKGQPIQYERSGSQGHGDVMLDIFRVTYPGLAKPLILYVDEYHFGQPKAPAGLSCAGPFPLSGEE